MYTPKTKKLFLLMVWDNSYQDWLEIGGYYDLEYATLIKNQCQESDLFGRYKLTRKSIKLESVQ